MTTGAQPLACLRHSETETRLTCNRCGDPICPKCMVQATVGIRCPNCANYEFNPIVQVKRPTLLKASAAGIGAGVAVGLLWGILGPFIPFFGYAMLLIGVGVGYVVGEAVSAGAGRSRARDLQWPAAGGTVVAFGVAAIFMPFLATSIFGLLSGALGVAMAISRTRGR
jgi:hypothetical protein